MRLQKRAGLACLGVGLLALALRLALLPVRPFPEPVIHDEFTYILGAETFCLGRLANPPHPMWLHFESFQENGRPTYSSKYPPAQSLFLALGWKLFGHPWYGVWLSCGCMCAALCWMLQGWVGPRYALLGGLMAVAQWGIAGYWVNSYWGGAVAAGAGALVIGAVPRLRRRPTAATAALAALGIVVLANSRPYEGAVTVLAAALAMLVWRYRTHRPFRELLAWRVAVPAAAVLACGLGAMLYYNYRLTGYPLLMPYALNQKTYGVAPAFWILPLSPVPAYHHDVIRQFWTGYEVAMYHRAHAAPWIIPVFFLRTLWYYFVTPISVIALAAALLLRRGRKVSITAAIAGIAAAGLCLEKFPNAHYYAPATGAILMLVVLGIQYVRVKAGKLAATLLIASFFALAAVQVTRLTGDEYPETEFTLHRLAAIHRLESIPGRHLVIVRYGPGHNLQTDWVFNQADIDGSRIVWARDMGASQNRELIEYYKDRRVWLLEPESSNPLPVPYDTVSSKGAPAPQPSNLAAES